MIESGLTRLVYHSRMAAGVDADARAALVATSRRHNEARGLRGGLVLYRGVFMQALEGGSEAIGELLRQLLVDPRHHAVTLVALGPVEAHALPPVSLAMLEDEDAIEELLARRAARPPFDPSTLDAAAMTTLVRDACLTRTFFLD
ncbi:BLUF domain-containing protein [Salinarimonas rosea]|uniref:BLUF domain-containing protein n=1 Tax=Salinarimonas rosea TaxID=552063 RepID=UPI0004082C76|nr:BLUF domain-containing protein [Salinarimonas rosea]